MHSNPTWAAWKRSHKENPPKGGFFSGIQPTRPHRVDAPRPTPVGSHPNRPPITMATFMCGMNPNQHHPSSRHQARRVDLQRSGPANAGPQGGPGESQNSRRKSDFLVHTRRHLTVEPRPAWLECCGTKSSRARRGFTCCVHTYSKRAPRLRILWGIQFGNHSNRPCRPLATVIAGSVS
jgi:hypothetical protein